MTTVRRALVLSLAERHALIGLSFASNILLARLLSPEAIGIYSVSLAVIGIAHVLRDFGIGSYLIQKHDLNDAHIRTAFGLSLLTGSMLFAALFLGAPAIANFYANVRMEATVRVVAVNFLTLPFCTVSMALLRREMRFRAVMVCNLVAATAGFVTTISLALAGAGELSMAAGSIVTNLALGLCSWLARQPRRLIRPSLSEWRELTSFGGQSVLTGIVGTVAMDANELISGKLLGFQAVAMISRAQGLMNIYHRDLMSAVRSVALPAFSAAAREGRDTAQAQLHGMAMVTVLGWCFYALVSVFALDILRLLFGHQWDAAAPLVPLFCLGGAIAGINSLTPAQLIAKGKMAWVTRVELVVQPVRVLILVVALSQWATPAASAWAYVAAAAFGVPLYQVVRHRALPIPVGTFLFTLLKSLLVALGCVTPALLLIAVRGSGPDGERGLGVLITSVILGLPVAALTARVLRHPISQEPLVVRFEQAVRRRFARLPGR
jgi:lipopolysaccharide exporter